MRPFSGSIIANLTRWLLLDAARRAGREMVTLLAALYLLRNCSCKCCCRTRHVKSQPLHAREMLCTCPVRVTLAIWKVVSGRGDHRARPISPKALMAVRLLVASARVMWRRRGRFLAAWLSRAFLVVWRRSGADGTRERYSDASGIDLVGESCGEM